MNIDLVIKSESSLLLRQFAALPQLHAIAACLIHNLPEWKPPRSTKESSYADQSVHRFWAKALWSASGLQHCRFSWMCVVSVSKLQPGDSSLI